MNNWFFMTAGCASLATALLWQLPFDRELTIIGLVAVGVAVGGYLRDFGNRT